MNLSPQDTTVFLLSIGIMLLFARAFGELSRMFKQPLVIGEILAGIILGPTIFGSVFPNLFKSIFESSTAANVALQGITILAVTMLLLVSGLEVNLTYVIRQGKTAFSISSMGILFPFTVGFLAAYFFPEALGIKQADLRFIFALFVGTALSITALPVVARTLMDLNIFKTQMGSLIIASAMFNDLIGWLIFSIILAMMGEQSHNLNFGVVILFIIIFVVAVLLIGRKIFNSILSWIDRKTNNTGLILNFVLILGFMGAAFTESIGIHAIFGAFIIGLAIGDSVYLKEHTREIIQQFVTNIFAPLFFVSIGLRVNFIQHFDLQIVLTFLILAFIGKIVGCGLGAYWGGLNKEDSLAIGFGMNSRGAMEIVLGILAYQVGLIHEKVFVALVIMSLITSITSAPAMSYFLRKSKKKLSFNELLNSENIIIVKALNKTDVIKELCRHLSITNKLDGEKIFNQVMEREKDISTGLENHLAIPHARVNVQSPLVAVGLHKSGIDFDSLDSLPAKVIVLLLIPVSEPELQLKLLAEISKKFISVDIANEIVEMKRIEEIISKLKQLS
jgi:Kef-type K+ transport system membrane component KefB/mannitol/fructose-specific phosphotransferase system IIA component (Ntr-type)